MVSVSVVVPTYNNENYIRTCINNLLAQTLKNIEIIVIDDCSTDNTWKILKMQYLGIKKIIRVRNETNIGTSASRNKGTELANGKYITYVDHDDIVEPTYLEVMYNNAERYDADISACGAKVKFLNDEPRCYVSRKKYIKNDNDNAILEALTKFEIDTITWGKIIRRDLVQKYDLKFPKTVMEDIYFWFLASCYANSYISTDEMLYTWKVNDSSQSIDINFSNKYVDNFCSVKDRAKNDINIARGNGVKISPETEQHIYEFLIETSVYTMHKFMTLDIWPNIVENIECKLNENNSGNAIYISKLLTMYSKIRNC